MGSPAVKGTKIEKRHPACPGPKSECNIKSCVHNSSRSNVSSAVEISRNFDEVQKMFGTFPSIRFAGGWVYQRLDAVSERANTRGPGYETNAAVDTMMYSAQIKIREMSGVIFDRIKSCLNGELHV